MVVSQASKSPHVLWVSTVYNYKPENSVAKTYKLSPQPTYNLLQRYTKGSPQLLVDNYKKGQGEKATTNLKEIWADLERRFGSSAALTQDLHERLSMAANFADKDNATMQKLADLCTDVDYQVIDPPRLACLNYPIALRPIVEKLPLSFKTKWQKQIVPYTQSSRTRPIYRWASSRWRSRTNQEREITRTSRRGQPQPTVTQL